MMTFTQPTAPRGQAPLMLSTAQHGARIDNTGFLQDCEKAGNRQQFVLKPVVELSNENSRWPSRPRRTTSEQAP